MVGYYLSMRPAKTTELISCHDCGEPVSFSAASCPSCGSTEPQGPYVHNRSERRRHRREERNDLTLMISVIACGLGGAFYGAVTASGTLSAILFGIAYGGLGVLIGTPIGFVVNMTRYLNR